MRYWEIKSDAPSPKHKMIKPLSKANKGSSRSDVVLTEFSSLSYLVLLMYFMLSLGTQAKYLLGMLEEWRHRLHISTYHRSLLVQSCLYRQLSKSAFFKKQFSCPTAPTHFSAAAPIGSCRMGNDSVRPSIRPYVPLDRPSGHPGWPLGPQVPLAGPTTLLAAPQTEFCVRAKSWSSSG